MNKSILKDILFSQDKFKKKDVVLRDLFLSVQKEISSPFVVVVSGVRRCGKSTLLLEIKKNAYYVNFDDERFIGFTVKDFSVLEEILLELFGVRDFFIFDEIQNILGWERFVRRLHESGKKVFVTGSNATMLSRELGTHLTGRTINYNLFPFSFKEFLRFNNEEINSNNFSLENRAKLKKYFLEYFEFGGFPEYLKTKNKLYLQSLYENIVYKDIIVRYNLPSEQMLKQAFFYAISNIGKLLSYNQVRKITGLSSATTIKEYFSYAQNSFLFFEVAKFDKSLKNQFYANKKVYCIDNALASLIGFRFSKDSGRLLENIVFLELKRMSKEIYYYKEKFECDFVIKKGLNIVEAIQVCYQLNEENKVREISGLIDACKTHNLKEGLLLTFDDEEVLQKDGIKVIVKPVWKWLLE
ncbi:MAG: ATP-binding protein [Candidatus ainarchaeum sp.]|nr:ATP-binding protein [Candidatus ainarchaeum sp.]